MLLQAESEALVARTRGALDRARELKGQAEAAEAAAEAVRGELRAAAAELAATKADAEGMTRVIATLERTIADHVEREQRVAKAEADAAAAVRVLGATRSSAERRPHLQAGTWGADQSRPHPPRVQRRPTCR